MKYAKDLKSKVKKDLSSKKYRHLMKLDDLISGNLEKERVGDSSPIYLEIEGGSIVELS